MSSEIDFGKFRACKQQEKDKVYINQSFGECYDFFQLIRVLLNVVTFDSIKIWGYYRWDNSPESVTAFSFLISFVVVTELHFWELHKVTLDPSRYFYIVTRHVEYRCTASTPKSFGFS